LSVPPATVAQATRLIKAMKVNAPVGMTQRFGASTDALACRGGGRLRHLVIVGPSPNVADSYGSGRSAGHPP
jgi:hypothetical protein